VDPQAGILAGRCVISVTPNALRSDSRTLKQAASISRAGARSIVIEGCSSNQNFSEIGIEVRSLAQASTPKISDEHAGASRAPSDLIRRCLKWLLPSRAVNIAVFVLTVWSLIRLQWVPLYRQLDNANFYVLHSFHFWPAVFLKTRMNKSFYIYDAHDFYREMDQVNDTSAFTRQFLIPLYRWLDEKAVRYSRAMTTVSDGVAELYAHALGIRPTVFSNAHDRRLDQACKRSLRDVTGVAPDKFLIVAVGNAKPGTSMEALLEAISAADESIEIAFVGRGFEKERARLQLYPAAKRVHFIDPIPADQVVPFIASADCGVIVYHAYTDNYDLALPNRFFQCIAAGMPLIYPRLREMERLAENFSVGIGCDPRDAADVLRAILKIAHDPVLRETMRRHAAKAALSLSWEREEDRFVTFLETLLSAENLRKKESMPS
jgi:glycosyltransferase involved in cell wall biosynthesis